MRTVGIKTLINNLSAYVQFAASGETILITNRDRVVAELGPIQDKRSSDLSDAFLADLVRSGVLTPPLMPSSTPPLKPNPIGNSDDVMQELDESREDR